MKYKFRGMSVGTKEWVYGDLIHNGYDGTSCMIPVGIAQPRFYPIEVIPETVGMWTGLCDKNEKEIYEGDIITDSKNRIGIIIFDSGAFIVDYGMGAYYNEALCVLLNRFLRFEVTGNIHEKEKPL